MVAVPSLPQTLVRGATLCLAALVSPAGDSLEYHAENFLGMVQLGCIKILLRHI